MKSLDPIQMKARIEKAYAASGNSLHWRFLASPCHVLKGADVALIDLNPGGGSIPEDHPDFCMPSGSAYELESWDGGKRRKIPYPPGESPLQIQMRTLFLRLCVKAEDVLAGHLVPFRSPSWKELKGHEEALRFGRQLWREVFDVVRPSLVVVMGLNDAGPIIESLLGAGSTERVPIGWGAIAGRKSSFAGGRLVVLPHLSRFKVVTKEKCQPALQELFGRRYDPSLSLQKKAG
ncbi:MAG: hypothetical protein KDK08_08440 [Rhizobiaceae bacterium]|nr:hypothetical protein [Rhizobiaceae bacterium]MCB1507704.1 hypothetical protein [Hyphomicrobiaceae bacterium]